MVPILDGVAQQILKELLQMDGMNRKLRQSAGRYSNLRLLDAGLQIFQNGRERIARVHQRDGPFGVPRGSRIGENVLHQVFHPTSPLMNPFEELPGFRIQLLAQFALQQLAEDGDIAQRLL